MQYLFNSKYTILFSQMGSQQEPNKERKGKSITYDILCGDGCRLTEELNWFSAR